MREWEVKKYFEHGSGERVIQWILTKGNRGEGYKREREEEGEGEGREREGVKECEGEEKKERDREKVGSKRESKEQKRRVEEKERTNKVDHLRLADLWSPLVNSKSAVHPSAMIRAKRTNLLKAHTQTLSHTTTRMLKAVLLTQ